MRTLTSALAMATILAFPARESLAANGAFAAGAPSLGAGVVLTQSESTDTITVSNPTSIITWTPTDVQSGGGPIDFLPSGTTANYRNDPSLQGGFTVLNRILPNDPTRAVALNGAINSRLYDGNNNLIGTGGNVWFYSPGGLLVGASASIDVGGIILSSVPIDFGGLPSDPNPDVVSIGASDAGRTVEIQTANFQASNYVGVLAPRIVQSGSVASQGSVAYVAAERADITFSSGLFDISVPVGTGAADAITHSGTTVVTPQGSGTSRNIYLVAVPKNQALTMLLTGGSLEFSEAGGASVTDQGVILSAGNDVFGNTTIPNNQPGTGTVRIQGGSIGADATIGASRDLTLSGTTFLGDASIDADNGAGADIIVDTTSGNVSVAGAFVIDTGIGESSGTVTGGNVSVLAGTSGTISAGSLRITTSANGGDGGTGTAGDVTVRAQGSDSAINIGGLLTIEADGGGGGAPVSGNGGDGVAGTVLVSAISGGALNLGGLDITASGFGGFSSLGVAGNGLAGKILLGATDGQIAVGGSGLASLVARGSGGNSSNGTGGNALSVYPGEGPERGYVGITASGATASINFGTAQNPLGLFVRTSANGGDSLGGSSGNARAGGFDILASNGATVAVRANVAFEGDATIANGGSSGGGSATGGRFGASADGGTLNFFGPVDASMDASGGANSGGAGGIAVGGNANIVVAADGTIDFMGPVSISGTGTGGSSPATNGGAGTGGELVFGGGVGTINANSGVSLFANGFGGQGETAGGDGQGGTANIAAIGGTTMTLGSVLLIADGDGGDAVTGGIALTNSTGGIGTGGFAGVTVRTGSTLSMSGGTIQANGQGGAGYSGGIGQGGFDLLNGGGGVAITAQEGTININGVAVTLNANGQGGQSFADVLGSVGNAGLGIGGDANIAGLTGGSTVGSVTASSTEFFLNANGAGGFGGNAASGATGGFGGAATGGSIFVGAQAGLGQLNLGGPITLTADAAGGAGGSGGQVPSGPTQGGAGGVGGDATGGSVQVGLVSGPDTAGTQGRVQLGGVTVSANAIAGNGGEGGPSIQGVQGDGGAGGLATGGQLSLDSRGSNGSDAGLSISGLVNFAATGSGGNGGSSETPGAGGSGTGGSLGIVSTARFNQPTVRGDILLAGVTADLSGFAGVGSEPGTATVGNFSIVASNGDITSTALVDIFGTGVDVQQGAPDNLISATDGAILFDNPSGLDLSVDMPDRGITFEVVGTGTITAAQYTLNTGTVTGECNINATCSPPPPPPTPPSFDTGATLPDAETGTSYNQSIAAVGGVPPYSFAVTGGTVPLGLVVDSAGNITGTPQIAGPYSFEVTVTDANNQTASMMFSIQVQQGAISPPPPPPPPPPAGGGAFAGTPGQLSTAEYDIVRNPGSDTITVNAPTAIINWTPDDAGIGGGDIVFLPSSSSVLFRNSVTNTGGFTVLNRIIPNDPSRRIALNGTIQSRLYDSSNTLTGTGGNVWFYSPGGILVGSTALIDVGGLVLSTVDIGFSDPFISNPDLVSVGASLSNASIGIASDDVSTNGYAVLLAPSINQSGTVTAAGDVFYVAAEQANVDVTGLTGVTVVSGTGLVNALTHGGITNVLADGAASRTVSLAVAPKTQNAVLDMTGGTIDFTLSGGADPSNQSIVIAAGSDLGPGRSGQSSGGLAGGGVIVRGGDFSTVANVGTGILAGAPLFLTGGSHFGGDLTVNSFGTGVNFGVTTGSSTFDGVVSISALGNVVVGVSGVNETLNFASDLSIITARSESGDGVGASSSSVTIEANGQGSFVQVNGDLTVDTSAFGGGATSGVGGAGTGGAILISAVNGSINLTGASLTAIGTGGSGITAGGVGQGGSVTVSASGGTISFAGPVTANVNGAGGAATTAGGTGGAGTGGAFAATAGGGVIGFGILSVNANGEGGTSVGGLGGLGTGGNISVTAANQDISMSLTDLGATGFGGMGRDGGGEGRGGVVVVEANNGRTISATTLNLTAQGVGGNSGFNSFSNAPEGAAGGQGRGGAAAIRANRATITVSSSAQVDSSGQGGSGDNGGDGLGGTAADFSLGSYVDTTSGTLNFNGSGVTILSNGTGGQARESASGVVGTAGAGRGGYAELLAFRDAANPSTSTITASSATVSASGFGASAGTATASGAVGGIGGEATGGEIAIGGYAGYSTVSIGTTSAQAIAMGGLGGDGVTGPTGGAGGRGGDATGGRVDLGIFSGPTTPVTQGTGSFGNTQINVYAEAGDGGAGAATNDAGANGVGGAGGNAVGGSTAILARGVPVTLGTTLINASATSGSGGIGAGGPGGSGTAQGGSFAAISSYRFDGDTNSVYTPLAAGDMTISSINGDVSGYGPLSAAGSFLINTAGGDLEILTNVQVAAGGTASGPDPSEVSAGNGTLAINTFGLNGSGPVGFFLDPNGNLSIQTCTVNGQPCAAPVTRNSP
ncbi:hypothetical protein, partial [Rhizorhabdus sp. FW153]|uniref:hypothetical protein n=1 Tax=Rhizorhabdus sp. FW153 TaxID=3400216 RepID=UPI003CE7956F